MEYMPSKAEKEEQHLRVTHQNILEAAADVGRVNAEHRERRRKVWDEANKKKEQRQVDARKKLLRHNQKIQKSQQEQTQVLQLVARVNYALNKKGIGKVINGVKVKDVKSLFYAMDSDGSGDITKSELEDGLRRLKINMPENTVELFMQELDQDLSGTLEYPEFMKWWEQAEVVQDLAQRREDKRNMDMDESNRRIRSSSSAVVHQLHFILKGIKTKDGVRYRKLYGKDITDVRSFFNAIDSDGTGRIHPFEISAGLRRLDIKITDGDIQALVETIDSDGDGEMDIMEVMSWADYQLVGASVAMQIREVFEENRTLYGFNVRDAESLFEAIDIDGNGLLSFEEVSDGLRQLQLNVGFPEIDAWLATLGKDRGDLIDKEELIWVLDHKSQMERIKGRGG
jgi:calcium-binding protein CML